ncbi:MAG: ABC transporter ATP-binding protein [Elusimicrobia bacterium]|nr:ABC transporter ATP-binding protein [Elusimicrobiota bacterium]
MGSDAAIVASGLGKRFMIGAADERRTLWRAVHQAVTGRGARRELWALRDLDFEVRRGEMFGVIGPNGAGKSTLLLLMAGIFQPTAGSIRISGKTDPFFQLGAGLKPRLSVRDNFALSAALLGIPRREFLERLPRMLEFSGLQDYLYARLGELSSGLMARLPFAAALHANLDIILIDEMLLVGDLAFQARCREAFKSFVSQGKTLVVVSHDLELIRSQCGRALYLKGGRPAFCGSAGEVVERLLRDNPVPGASPKA